VIGTDVGKESPSVTSGAQTDDDQAKEAVNETGSGQPSLRSGLIRVRSAPFTDDRGPGQMA
jgi:hypothetical protein